MKGWNGGRASSQSYRNNTGSKGSLKKKIGSNASSSSGTIVSNLSSAYASSGSRLSTFSMEAAAMHFDSLGIHDRDMRIRSWIHEDSKDLIRSLILEFLSAPSASCSIKRGDMSAVERGLKQLGADWLFSLEDGASAGEDDRDMRISSWIRALEQITHTLCFWSRLFLDSDCGSVGLPGICEEEEGKPAVAENSVPERYHLVLFVQETMLKMLTFVDVLVAWDPDRIEYSALDQVMYTKLFHLLLVHDALSEASNKIVTTLFDSPTSVEVGRIQNEMVSLLSTYKSKASEVIRSTMEKIRIMSMEDGDDSPSPLDLQGSSDIHRVTRSVLAYIDFLMNRSQFVNQVMQPCTKNVRPLDNMIAEIVSSLKQKLVNISESFPEQGLKLLFLLNNSELIQWRLQLYDLRGPELLDVEHKVEGYMERYIQVSCAPLLSCLGKNFPTPSKCVFYLLLSRRPRKAVTGKIIPGKYSPLSKFESEFQKIYTIQKQWKVPDPELRRRLRKAIIGCIIPGYTKYIEDNEVTHPKISPQELEAMLQELFEG